MDFAGKIVLITGAGKGIGRIVAKRFASLGGTVIVNCFHSFEQGKQTVDEILASGGEATVIRASVAKRHQLQVMFQTIRERYGRLDVLVNNAASGALVPVSRVTEEVLDKSFNTNLKGSFWCSTLAAELMQESGQGGSIVNLSTLGGGQLVMDNYLGCGPAKAAVESLSRYLAAEWGPHSIRVNVAAAGMIEGDVADAFPDATAMHDRVRAATPMGRLGRPEEFADLILFLASEQARWITGQTIVADGGLSTGKYLLSPLASLVANVGDSPLNGDLDSPPSSGPAKATATAPVTSSKSVRHANGASASATKEQESVEETDAADPVVIVGMGLVVPGGNNTDEFWQVIQGDNEAFTRVPADRWQNESFFSADRSAVDKTYQEKSGFITNFVSTRPDDDSSQAESTTRWLRSALHQSLKDVTLGDGPLHFMLGYTADGCQHLEESMVVSGYTDRIDSYLRQSGVPNQERVELADQFAEALGRRYHRGGLDNVLPHQVCAESIKGILPERTQIQIVDTACSSSLYAIDIGMKRLEQNTDGVAVCAGAFSLGPRGSILFAKLNGLSVSGRVRSLDQRADGVLFADGAAVVVLKTLSRAQRDGDKILAVVESVGSSSDGKGKAVYAPNASGQQIAVERAFAKSTIRREDVDWVIAHATGTPAGDLAEFTSLRREYEQAGPVFVTSNKAAIGHTGWAAGVVSVIEAILGLQHNVIPRQHGFAEPPQAFEIESTNFSIPTSPIAWPEKKTPRCIGISGFGFGGTNAHLLLREYRGSSPPQRGPRPDRPRLAIVGWSAHVPGCESETELRRWLSQPDSVIPNSFGHQYPMPEFKKVRMPPKMIRTIDRCQLMVLECSHQLKATLGDLWEQNKDRMGVFLGHMGPTRNASLYATRCYLDDAEGALRGSGLWQNDAFTAAWKKMATDLESLVPPSNEDSFPGSMPNVIPARVANFFDLHGPNMTIDTGAESSLSAIETAMLYLSSGEVTVALVGGLHGNVTPEMRTCFAGVDANPEANVREGAFFLAVTTEAAARKANLPVLGTIAMDAGPIQPGDTIADENRTYFAGDGVRRIIQSLLNGQSGSLPLSQRPGAAALRWNVPSAAGVETHPISDRFAALHASREADNRVQRYAVRLASRDGDGQGAGWEFFPTNTLVVTPNADLISEVPADCQVLCLDGSGPNATKVEKLDAANVGQLVNALGYPIEHLRVLLDLNRVHAPDAADVDRLRAFHDLVFLVLQSSFATLQAADSTWVTILLGACDEVATHPHWASGLFTGLQKGASLELAPCRSFCMLSAHATWAPALQDAMVESRRERGLPVVFVADGYRNEIRLVREDQSLVAADTDDVPANSVWIVAGGSRGITGEILQAVSREFRPIVYVLGSNPLDSHPDWIYAGDEETFLQTKSTYIRDEMAKKDGRSVADVANSFQRFVNARQAKQNLRKMESAAGVGRVHYRHCDLTDMSSTKHVVEAITSQHPHIHYVVFSAGLNRSTPLPSKSLSEFRKIRDVKWRGYCNLKQALADNPPSHWINFGSLLGLTGQIGECDYASGNDLLLMSALGNQTAAATKESTIGWTLWGEVGMGANELTKAYFEKSGTYSNMSTQEGIHHFVRELYRGHGGSMVHIGAAEKRAVGALLPSFLACIHEDEPGRVSAAGPRSFGFYLDSKVSSNGAKHVFERMFSSETDHFLSHHAVNGAATLPGTFVAEIAAEVLHALAPEMQLTSMEDIVFHRFLKVMPVAASNSKRIEATVLGGGDDKVAIRVRVLTDVVSKQGIVLAKDKLHFELRINGGRDVPEAPAWPIWQEAGEPVEDPYHMPGSPVTLSGPFHSTTDTRCHTVGKSAQFRLELGEFSEAFGRFQVPTLMMDGLARLGVLTTDVQSGYPVAAPLSIRRIDFYESGNDLTLSERYERIHLYCASAGLAFSSGSENRFVAATPAGRMILQMKDVRATVIGTLDATTGRFFPADATQATYSG